MATPQITQPTEQLESYPAKFYIKQNCSTILKIVAFAGSAVALFGISYISWVAVPAFQGIKETLYWNCVVIGASTAFVCSMFYCLIKIKILPLN